MRFDERAARASNALKERSRTVTPHHTGLRRRPWVAPMGIVSTLGLILMVTFAARSVSLNRSTEVEAVLTANETLSIPIDETGGPILAAFVSATGEVSVLAGAPLAPTRRQLETQFAAPVLGVETIPEPRWAMHDRVIEYVSEVQGELVLVQIDLITERMTMDPYLVVLTSGGAISTSLEEEGPLSGRVAFMAGPMGPFVNLIEDESGSYWRLRTLHTDEDQDLDALSHQFLAPTPEGLIVAVDGELSLIGTDGKRSQLTAGGSNDELIISAAAGPEGELGFGTSTGSVILMTADATAELDVGRDQSVTNLSWMPSGQALLAQTSSRGHATLYLCTGSSKGCKKIEAESLASSWLVRGIPSPRGPDEFPGIWPESTQSAADSVAETGAKEAWRHDPRLLVSEFADVQFGWPDAVVVQRERGPFSPQLVSFDVQPSSDRPGVVVTVFLLEGGSGWEVTAISGPSQFTSSSSSDDGVTIGFDRQGARTVTVLVGANGVEYEQSTDTLEQLKFVMEDSSPRPDYFVILFKDKNGDVTSASSGSLGKPIRRGAIG